MRKVTALIGIIAVLLCLSACGKKDGKTLEELAELQLPYNAVYIEENGVPQKFYVIKTAEEGQVLCYRAHALDTVIPFDLEDAVYEGSAVDTFLSGEYRNSLACVDMLIEKEILTAIEAGKNSAGVAEPEMIKIKRTVFLPAISEVTDSGAYGTVNEGVCIPSLSSNSQRVAYNDAGTAVIWLLRSSALDGGNIWSVFPDGGTERIDARYEASVRPFFCLPSSLQFEKKLFDGQNGRQIYGYCMEKNEDDL